jgi:DNA-directed RNA polymerase specialized sigma24 family protein
MHPYDDDDMIPPDPDPRPDQLAQLAQALPETTRVILALVVEGATHREIADHFGLRSAAPITRAVGCARRLLTHLVSVGYLDIDTSHPDPLVAAYLQTLSPTRAARTCGVTRRRVRCAVAREIRRLQGSSDPEDMRLLRVLVGLAGLYVRD